MAPEVIACDQDPTATYDYRVSGGRGGLLLLGVGEGGGGGWGLSKLKLFLHESSNVCVEGGGVIRLCT